MSKKKTAVDFARVALDYEVLIACGNDETGRSYAIGDTVTNADFPPDVIAAWLTIAPPVLRVKDAAMSPEAMGELLTEMGTASPTAVTPPQEADNGCNCH